MNSLSLQDVVLPLRYVRSNKLFIFNLLCLLLHGDRRNPITVRTGCIRSFGLLWTWMDSDVHFGKYKRNSG